MKKIFTAILAFAAILSCTQEKINDITSVEDVVSEFPLLKVDNGLTKTTFDGVHVNFEVGDCISVFNGIVSETDHHGHCKYRCISVENKVATFEWMAGMDESKKPAVPYNEYEPADDVDIIATYPNRSAATSAFEPDGEAYGKGTVMIRMPATGSASGNESFVSSSLPIIACAPQGSMLKFRHTCGVLELNMKGTATIAKVQILSENIISGNASVQYAAEEPVLTVVGTGNLSSDTKITYTYKDGVTLAPEGTKLYFGLPVGTHDLTFTFIDTDGNSMVKKAKGLQIKRAVATPSTLDYVPAEAEVTDLSAGDAYANCYVIKSSGLYSFDAKKPDGNVVTGVKAEWIWAAGEGCTTAGELPASMMSGIDYSDGKISFSVPQDYKGGNIVLGLVNSNNALEYTWHVWLTSSDLSDVTVSGFAVMDRNLGAICKYDVTKETVLSNMQYGRGNYYQWGRKDPILGARNAGAGALLSESGGNNQCYVINSDAKITNVSAWEVAETAGSTTEEAAAKPLVFVSTNTGVANYDPNDKTTPWCSRPNANPCPYGYRVMNDDEFSAIISGNITFEFNSGSKNMRQYRVGELIFPLSGNRGTDGKQTNLTEARYFSDNVDPTAANKGRNCKFSGTETAKAQQGSYGANTASSVRCVKE